MLAGAANACVLQDRDAGAPLPHRGGSPSWHQHAHEVAPTASAAIETDLADDCDPSPGAHACKNLCDASAGALVKTKPLDVPAGTSLFAAIATWAPHPAEPASTAWRVCAAPLPPGPPVAILFLRLTI